METAKFDPERTMMLSGQQVVEELVELLIRRTTARDYSTSRPQSRVVGETTRISFPTQGTKQQCSTTTWKLSTIGLNRTHYT